MRPACSPTPPSASAHPQASSRFPCRGLAVAVSLAFALTASCSAVAPTLGLMDPAQVALQETSQQPAPSTAPAPAPLVTQPWMEEALRKLDDRYAAAAADTRGVLEQSLSAINNLVTPAHLAPLRTSMTKLEGQLSSTSSRMESLLTGLQTRIRELERVLAEGPAERERGSLGFPIAGGSALAQDPDQAAYVQALQALQGTPHQTLPLRSWLENHPAHPKAPEALLQLGIVSLDSGYPTAAKHYFTQVVDHYGTSQQAPEAKAFLSAATKAAIPKSAAKPGVAKKAAAPAPAQASVTVAPAPGPAAPAPLGAAPAAPAQTTPAPAKTPAPSAGQTPTSSAVPQSLLPAPTGMAVPGQPEAPAPTKAATSIAVPK